MNRIIIAIFFTLTTISANGQEVEYGSDSWVEKLSSVSVYIRTYKLINGKEYFCSKATGFFYKGHLVTNWHVLSGRNFKTGEPNKINKEQIQNETTPIDASDPDTLEIYFNSVNLEEVKRIRIGLKDKEGQPIWTNSKLQYHCDLATIRFNIRKITELGFIATAVEELPLIDEYFTVPGDKVNIIGFPRGALSTNALPFWKTCFVANDHDIEIKNLEMFYVDGTTKSGLSGSPVFQIILPLDRRNKKTVLNKSKIVFLGVYSGRRQENLNLGGVWKRNILDRMME